MCTRLTMVFFVFAVIHSVHVMAADPARTRDAAPLIVHEWGTFTSLQDATGRTILRINSDDEPVPEFVHRLWGQQLVADARQQLAAKLAQGVPIGHPDVTMRMETPVIYFYPPPQSGPLSVDVNVSFPAGWITEFYPKASVAVRPHRSDDPYRIGSHTISTLSWKDAVIDASISDDEFPQTDESVWLAPRKTAAAPIRMSNGESEKYLFYRGVAHLDAPITASRAGHSLHVAYNGPAAVRPTVIKSPLWILDVLPNGRAYSVKISRSVTDSASGALGEAILPDTESKLYRKDSVVALRRDMEDELVRRGLFRDEARAMLETWSLSYFKSSGLRIFYLLDQEWTDAALPLSIQTQGPVEVTRVMVGRLELVAAWQENLLRSLRNEETSIEQRSASFEKLGRFRDAMVRDFAQQWNAPELLRYSSSPAQNELNRNRD